MKKQRIKALILPLCISAVLGMELAVLADALVVLQGNSMSLVLFAALWVAFTMLSAGLFRWKTKRLLTAAAAIPMTLALAAAVCFGGWSLFRGTAAYQDPDAGKNQIYGNRKVMLIVPHQDDDLNILGGVMEEYARYGSDLYGVFITNGDYAGLTETRYQEAISVFDRMGLPEDHVIFLGYGDNWKEGGPHLYNAPSGTVMESHIGRTQTYGTENHAPFREGREYTIDNLMEDLRSVILEYRPDVLFCSDYDHHIDHKATTLLFEKVMGQLLKENPDYRPTVYKAYAYGTAWEAEPDYYTDNVLSTQDPFAEPYLQMPAVYRWEDRVRFPVDGSSLSRSLVGSGAYEMLKLYTSQGAQWQAARVVNGDKVAWQRQTESLCLTAEVSATSGNGSLLNDFMLIENHDLVDAEHLPYDGIWIPELSDHQKTVTVTLAEPSDISLLQLYDHPSEEHNVLNAEILFEDGTVLETGPLDPGGAATFVVVKKEAVTSFCVTLTETEGELAGLSELEAFAEEPRPEGRFLKLMDAEENFLYDCLLPEDGQAELLVYTHGDLPEVTAENYTLGIDGDSGDAVLENGVIKVRCSAGGSFVLNVTCDAAGVSDTITIRNPGGLERTWMKLWQNLEKKLYFCRAEKLYENMACVQILTKISYKLRHAL